MSSIFRGPGTSPGMYPPRIACFVCGAEVPADYPLYPEAPIGNSGTTPHFPFLLSLEPPLGCRPPSPGGVAKSCRVCYSTLMRQWDEYEKGGVATDRRVYYVKRAEGLPFPSVENQMRLTMSNRKRPLQGLMGAPPPVTTYLHHQFELAERKSSPSPLAIATNGSGSQPVSPLATPIPVPNSSPSSSAWSRRPLAAQSASSAPSSLIQLSNDRGESSLVNVSETDSGALDLSSGSRDRENMKSRSSVASHHSSSYQSEGTSAASSASTNVLTGSGPGTGTTTATVTDIMDLTLPDKNASFEVCYVCGDEFKKGTLAYSFVKQVSPTEPFYPSLTSHPRPPRSNPIDASGRVQTCDECHEHLLAQWYTFEQDDVPHSDRNYSLRKRATPLVDLTTFVCYMCGLEYHSSSLRLLYSRPNSENEPYYPFIAQQKPPPGASPISPQGMVQVCIDCDKSTPKKHHGFLKADQPPPKKRRGNSQTFSLNRDPGDVYYDPSQQEDEEKALPADVTCPLCRRKFSILSFKFLHSQPHGGLPYFPFLRELPMPEDIVELEDEKQNRVRACQGCTTSLINQWTVYQRDQIPVEERAYVYESPLATKSLTGSLSANRPLTPASLRSHKSGRSAETPDKNPSRPRSNSNQLGVPGLPGEAVAGGGGGSILANPTTNKQVASVVAASRPRSDTHSPKISLPQQNSPGGGAVPISTSATLAASTEATTATPGISTSGSGGNTINENSSKPPANSSSFYCFLCGLHSELSFSRMLYSSAPGKKAPYFPFMKKHVPKTRAETLREDGTALVCTFCYHSVMVQWAKYNETRASSFVDPNDRTYNYHEYRCYVCGVMTYRKRIRALRVMDFPFLRQHKPRRTGCIMMENGEMVAVCLDCFDSLRGQFVEAGKYGIPVEKRQYNWMQIPPPPEAESSLITPQERLTSKFARPPPLSLAGPSPVVTTSQAPPVTSNDSKMGQPPKPAGGLAAGTNAQTTTTDSLTKLKNTTAS